MSKSIFVVTNPELGWDCVVGVYKANSEEEVADYFVKNRDIKLEEDETSEDWMENENYVIHQEYLTEL